MLRDQFDFFSFLSFWPFPFFFSLSCHPLDFQRKIFETTEAAITQLAEEREQMEQNAFSLYGQKMQEITATLERIGLFAPNSLPPPQCLANLLSFFFLFLEGKLETTLASFLGTIENIYQSVFPEAD